jgi:predicted nucleic acid-binding protein
MSWLFRDGVPDAVDYADRVLESMTQEGTQALVPCIWYLEVGNAIVRAEAKGVLHEARSAEFLGVLSDMAIEPDSRSVAYAHGEVLQLARRYQLSTYDASYLELALREGLPLATNDADLRRALTNTGGRLA